MNEKKVKKVKKDKTKDVEKKIFLKKINFGKFIDFLKNLKVKFLRRKKIAIIFITLFFIIIVFSVVVYNFFIKKTFDPYILSTKDFVVVVPENAFSKEMNFNIKKIPENSIQHQNLTSVANFYGTIYEVSSIDQMNESSFMPITIRYKIPNNLYFGDNFVNFSIGHISSLESRSVRELTGCRIVQIDGEYYVEGETFNLSYFGLIIKPPAESNYGLKMISNNPLSIEPDIILIAGSDNNFWGNISPLQRTTQRIDNIWSILFPERNIWIYNYPLLDTRSKVYYDSFMGFVMRSGINSYIEFESRRLAQELKRLPNIDFDIITHGVGGLIARHALESDHSINNIDNLVLISVPNNGTNLANPVMLNTFYGKNVNSLSSSFGVTDKTILSIQNFSHSFISSINNYYRDLVPNSNFLVGLNDLGLRDDIRYLSIAGNISGIDEIFQNSPIFKFYPEMMKGYGDGVVTVESALLEFATKNLKFENTYYNIYSNPVVLESIKSFLNESVERVEVKPFKDDFFIETVRDLEKVEGERRDDYNYFTFPSEYNSESIIEINNVLGDINQRNASLKYINNNLFIETFDGVYNSSFSKILNMRIYGGVTINNRYFVSTEQGVYATDSETTRFVKITDNIPFGDEVFYFPEIGFLSVNHLGGRSEVYLNNLLVESESRFRKIKIISNEIYLIFNDKISKISDNNLLSIITKEDILNLTDRSFANINDYSIYENLHFLLTSDYKVIMLDMFANKVQVIGDSDVGNLMMSNYNNKIYIFGDQTITYINPSNRIFEGNFQRLQENLMDLIIKADGEIFGIFNTAGGSRIWKGKIN